MADKPVKIAYIADEIDDLAELKTSCERDEGALTAEITALEMVKLEKAAGKLGILATYRVIPDEELPTKIKFGELFFVMPVDGQTLQQLKDQQKGLNRDFLFSSKLIIDGDNLNVSVFRPEPDED